MIRALCLTVSLAAAIAPGLAAQDRPADAHDPPSAAADPNDQPAAADASGKPAGAAAPQDRPTAVAVDAEFQKLAAARSCWPDFDPLTVPLAIFDGERTFLFRHPTPPEGFVQVDDLPDDALVFPGRHKAVTANSSAEIGGAATATLSLDATAADRSAAGLAATALHEAFHVFQRKEHRDWVGNEGDLFTYPVDDARLLGLRRREWEGWRRALAESDPGAAGCWARHALTLRGERFAGMDAVFGTYERMTELNEGLATYVQLIATGQTSVDLPAAEFAPSKVRDRAYAVGPAIAFLLDHLRPGWQRELQDDDEQTLDGMLQEALDDGAAAAGDGAAAGGGGARTGGAPAGAAGGGARTNGAPCALANAEVSEIERVAQKDIADELAARGQRRKAFDARTGWRVVVQASVESPLWAQGFDPLNIERMDGGMLHTRFLHLTGDNSELQFVDEAGVDIEALTEAVGPHPIFDGVLQVTVAGLPKPKIDTGAGQTSLRARGFNALFRDAKVEVTGTTVLVTFEPKPKH